ncbi:MAG: hypothetical protein JSS87_11150 [Acidobacteria bacterium]|nr:hypothetical protein [Acidobacteriota bacterium]
MKHTLKLGLFVAAVALAMPGAGFAQTYSCPGGATPIVVPGVGTFCPPIITYDSPEVSSSACVGGISLLMSGIMMIRGRRKKVK